MPPLRALSIRVAIAVGLVLFIVAIVYADSDGYNDNSDGKVDLLDAAYYAVVTLSTTGYGDIVPVSDTARAVNIFIITPARIMFLIILVGTTLEVLTEQFRTYVRLDRWRRRLKNHVIVCGFGTKGRSAVQALREEGTPAEQIVIVENDPRYAHQAQNAGYTVVEGNATRSSVLRQAQVQHARAVVIATHSDDSAVLTTLTVRQLTPSGVRIIAAAREIENAPLLKQSGAHQVVVSSATAGRLLGLATATPPVVDVIEDLLTPGEGMAIAVRSARREELGKSPRELNEVAVALLRRNHLLQLTEPEAQTLESGDMIIHVRDDRPTIEETALSRPNRRYVTL